MSDKDRLAAELGASNGRLAQLQTQLAERDRELAALRGELSAEMAKLTVAQRGLIRALRPEIDQGNITVDLNNERLRINLASSMLFGSGEDQLKPAGVDALKRVGAVLKDYPEYKVAVDGHTDNRPIRNTLRKRFPTNKELSTARAASGVTALQAGGISADFITSAGYADTKPVAPNTTDEGRQKNRRVEVSVTPKS
jgi:chemotaxis protein MotB